MSRHVWLMAAVVGAVLQVGAHARAQGEAAEEDAGMGMGMKDLCPMRVAGTQVSSQDAPGGTAITFTTSGDVAELRRRVRHMAQMHAMHGAMAPRTDADGGGMMMSPMPSAKVVVRDVKGGARLTFIAVDPSKVDALRAAVRERVGPMQAGDCPMMRTGTGGMGGTGPAEPADDTAHHPDGG